MNTVLIIITDLDKPCPCGRQCEKQWIYLYLIYVYIYLCILTETYYNVYRCYFFSEDKLVN